MIYGYIKKFVLKYWRITAVFVLAIIFFIGTSSFNYLTQKDDFIKWLSPDETSNYIFAKLYAQEKRLQFFEKYNLVADDIIKPRSFRSDLGWLKPVSFLGIILIYGKIASIFSYKVLSYLTPFIASIGIIYYYLFIKKIFGRSNAFISTVLLFSFPVYIYYSSRSFFHNTLFTVLFIIGLYYGTLIIKRKKVHDNTLFDNATIKEKNKSDFKGMAAAAISGLFMGLAIITRTSELIWLAPALFILWLFNLRRIGFIKLMVFLDFLFLAIMPEFYYNKILYGQYWYGGYAEMNQSINNIVNSGSNFAKSAFTGGFINLSIFFSSLKNNIFYFGWQPITSLKMFYHYFVIMFYWLFFPFVLGGLIFLSKIRKWQKKHWLYIISYFIIFLILVFYYGSWNFHDNPDPKSFTIGNSYTRYWLPIYLGALPFVSYFILKFSRLLRKKSLVYGTQIIILAAIILISLDFVLFGSSEGLVATAYNLKDSKMEYGKVLDLTESNSVIITRYHDKLFFPERKVIVGLFDDSNMISQYAKLIGIIPVYYYNFTFPQKDIDYLNNTRLMKFGLNIIPVKTITKDFTLYKIIHSVIPAQATVDAGQAGIQE